MKAPPEGTEAGSISTGSSADQEGGRPEAFQFLSELSYQGAFWCFLVSLVVGIALISLKLDGIWSTLPAVPVVAYGLLLRLASLKGDRALNDQEKDSPYFLGFILTLVALFIIFWSASGDAPLTMNVLGPQVGAAILVTMVGLVMRQYLIAVEPYEDIAVDGFEKLSDLAIKRLGALVKEEDKFQELTRDTYKNREKLWGREEKAVEKLVESYEAGSRRLSAQLDKASDTVSLAEDVRAGLEKLEAGLNDTVKGVEGAVTKLAKTAEIWVDMIEGLQSNTRQALKEHATELQQLAPTTRRVVTSYETEVERLTLSTSEAVRAVKVVSAEMKTISADLQGLSEQAADTTKATTRQVQEETTRALRIIAADVQRIDEIVDQLVAVLGKSLDSFGDSR